MSKANWLLVDRFLHRKNRVGLVRMCNECGVNLTITNSPDVFRRSWDLVYIPCDFIDPAAFPHSEKIVYGPQNFVFVDGIWKTGNFPPNCVYNLLSEWVDQVQLEFGGVGMKTKLLPFPVEIDVFTPDPSVPKRFDCFVYYKHRHSHDLSLVLNAVEKRNLTYKLIEYGSYSEDEFLQVVRSSAFGIWVGSHESQGFALEEALACDTPLLVWNSTTMFDEHVRDCQIYKDKVGAYSLRATSHPYWDDTCGISFTDPKDLEARLDTMINTHAQFCPRAYIEKTLSISACMARFVDELGLYKDRYINCTRSSPSPSSG